ncbi:hypothetical protein FRC07_002459 [Ceratobasidium sp. 392]|nr:hypothetical protein FRC07_002459 [Ceratobasidium sp. 392]
MATNVNKRTASTQLGRGQPPRAPGALKKAQGPAKAKGPGVKPGDGGMDVDIEVAPDSAWMWVGAGSGNIVQWGTTAGRLFVESFVVGRFRTSDEESHTRLATLVAKAFTAGPLVKTSGDNDTVEWSRAGAKALLEDEVGGFRNDGHELVVFGHPRSFWPPVLERGTVGSLSWSFTAKDLTEDGARDVCRGLGDDTWGARYCFRRLTESGKKSHDFVVVAYAPSPAAMDPGFESVTVGAHTLTRLLRCSFCQKNGAKHVVHETRQCPVLGMANKLRENAGLNPILVSEHAFDFATGERTVDAPKLVAALEKRVEALEKKVKALEEASAASSKKRKPDADPKAGPSKKGKKDNAGEGGAKGGKGKQAAK